MRGRGIALVAGARMGQRSAAQQMQVQEQQHQAELQTQKAQMEAQAAQTKAASAPGVDITGEIQKLAQLHQSGMITDAEFAAAKQKLLAQ